jgi:pentose-5-phosphate-3-epimerase
VTTDTVKLAPSILAADFARLGDQVAEAERAGADRIHVDVMDGHFVPNLSMGPPIIRSMRKTTRLALEAHLMISNPDLFVEEFVQAGADSFLVHWEGNNDLSRTVQRIKALGKRVGVAISHDREPGIRASALSPHDTPEDQSSAPDDRSDQPGLRARGGRRDRCNNCPTSSCRGRRRPGGRIGDLQ